MRVVEIICKSKVIFDCSAADRRKGHANYVITQILRKAWGVDRPENESYSNYADIIGTLECAKHELYRRRLAAYEDTAIARHGDL